MEWQYKKQTVSYKESEQPDSYKTLYTITVWGQKEKLQGCSPTEEMWTYGPPSHKKSQKPAPEKIN